jgi:hypothetical protein
MVLVAGIDQCMFWPQVIYKRRMRAMLVQWYELAAGRRSRRMRLAKAGRHFARQQYIKAWNSWQVLVQVRGWLGVRWGLVHVQWPDRHGRAHWQPAVTLCSGLASSQAAGKSCVLPMICSASAIPDCFNDTRPTQ